MLELNLETVGYIIIKAREFDAKVDPVDENPGSDEADDGERVILEDFADDPTFQELKEAIDELNEDESAHLVALMWLGRGTFSKEEWDEAVETARNEATHAASDYLMGTPLLGDFLEDGLNELGLSMDQVDLTHL
ncbi:MAG: DUF3775 domain-containing protein [Alphaproteobacteria bacterium]|nr:DUF3775 domain-containing protein [Alphaproteobacteria bacterium]